MSANPHLTVGGSSWSGNPPLATLRQLTSSSSALYTYTTATSNVLQGEIDAIVAGGTTALWANYKAIHTVDLSGNNITNGGSVTATSFTGPLTGAVTGNVTGNLTGNVSGSVTGNTSGTHTGQQNGNVSGDVTGNIYNTNLTVGAQYSITETADVGSALSNYGNYGTVNISGKGGLGGIVNITADVATPLNPAVTVSQMTLEAKGNYGLITLGTPVGYIPRGGLVSIIARQGLTPTPPAEATSALFANGEIDLTAYSYGVVPGLIKLSAGANFMYAGLFSPITGIYGNNYIAATVANTMTAGLPPGGIPTLVGTNYFYAVLGVGGSGSQIVGNRFQGGVGIDFLQPYPNGDLIIQSNANGTDTVVISGVKSLAMSNAGNITGVGNINLTTINGAAYPPLTVTDPTFNSVSTNRISTGASFISSINGLPISAYTNVGDAIFNSISTNQISTGASFISSINGLPMSAYTNVGDATFNSISASKISTARVSMSSINDSIYFGNLPIGNNIAGINDLQAATGTFNTSLTTNGSLTAGSAILGATTIAGAAFRVTNGSINVATINTSGNIAGATIAVTGLATSGTLQVTNSATVGNGLTVTGGTTLNGTTTTGLIQGTTMNYANANGVNANFTNANLINTNTGVINAGAGALALTYGSITFNGSPYAPTAGTSSDPTFNSISSGKISTGTIRAGLAFADTVSTATLLGAGYLGLLQIGDNTNNGIQINTGATIRNTAVGASGQFIIDARKTSIGWGAGGIDFNGSPYAPFNPDGSFTSLTAPIATVGGLSSFTVSTGNIYLSSINGVAYSPGGGSDPTFNSVSTNQISTGRAFISSINGFPYFPCPSTVLSTFISSFNNFNISSLFASSIQVRGGLNFSTPMFEQNGQYDITKTFNLVSTSYDAVAPFQNNILNYTYTLSIPAGALVSWPFPPSANLTLLWDEVGTWGNNVNTLAKADPGTIQKQAQISLPNDTYGGTPVAGTFADFYNQFQIVKMTIYNIGFGVIVDIPLKSTYRVTWTGTTWTVNTTPSPIATTNTTNFNITQNINGAAISTSDVLTLTGTSIYMNTDYVYANDLEASNINIVSLSSFVGNISTLTSYNITSDYINAYSTTTTWGKSLALSNTGTISTLNLGANNVVANYITAKVNLTAPSITVPTGYFTNLNTDNINNNDTITSYIVKVQSAGANGYLYADSAYTSTFAIQSGLAYPFTLSQITYSNVEPLANGNVLNVPTTKALMHNEKMYITSPNPAYTYTGTGPVTFKLDGTVDIAGTPLTTFGWQQGTFTATKPMTLNVSTPTAYAFPLNAHVANLITTSPGTIAFYTSGGGFAGNIPTNTSLALIYDGTLLNWTTGTFSALNPILFQSYIQTEQSLNGVTTITNVSTITKAPYIGFGNNGYQIDTFQIRLQGFLIPKTAPNGGAYGFADNGTRITNPITGRTYLLSEWNCLCSLAGHNAYSQTTLATNEAVVTTQSDSGYWKAQAYLTTATFPGIGTNLVYWNVAVTMIPIAMGGIAGLQTATNVGDVIPSTVQAFNVWALETPLANLSTVTASTFQVIADTNLSLNAGLGFPTFLNNGTVSINASTNVDLMANYDITLGAAHDINATGTSNIRLTSPYIKLDRTGGGNLILDTNVDLNCANGHFLTLGNSGGGSYFQIQSGGAQVLTVPAGQSITLDGQIIANCNLYMNNHTIYNPFELYNNNTDLLLTGIGRNIILQTFSGGGIYLNGAITASSNLNMNSNNINNTANINGTDIQITGTNTVYINANYSTWTGSNNFNIIASNVGITTSNSFTIDATGSGLRVNGDFKRQLSATAVTQPVIQYGTVTGSGASGSVTVALPVAYTSGTSYIATASMMDVDPARMSVNRDNLSSITIYWFQAGSGTQTLGWNTMGS